MLRLFQFVFEGKSASCSWVPSVTQWSARPRSISCIYEPHHNDSPTASECGGVLLVETVPASICLSNGFSTRERWHTFALNGQLFRGNISDFFVPPGAGYRGWHRVRAQEIRAPLLPAMPLHAARTEPSAASRIFWAAFGRFLLQCGKWHFRSRITFFMAPKLLNLQIENNLGNGRICFHVWSGLKWVWCSLCSFSSNYHKMEFWPKIIQLYDSGISSVVLCDTSLVLISGDT